MSHPNMQHSHPDPDDREPRKPKAKVIPWANVTDDQRAEIERIKDLQTRLGLTKDVDFCRDCDVHPATWGQLKRGVYPGKVSALLQRMTAFAALVEELHAQKAGDRGLRLHEHSGFVRFSEYDSLNTAAKNILSAADLGSENKCIWVVGRTGAGKDACANHLMSEGFTTWKFTARPSWRHRYMPALLRIASGLKIAKKLRGVAAAETAILDYLDAHKGLLLFTEVELLCKDTLDFFRSVLNETACGIVIFITPEYYERLRERGDTGTVQLFRRSELVIHLKEITDDRVLKILEKRWEITDDLKRAAKELAAEAETFGAMDFVQRVVTLTAKTLQGSKHAPTLDLIRRNIRDCRAFVPSAKTGQDKRRVA